MIQKKRNIFSSHKIKRQSHVQPVIGIYIKSDAVIKKLKKAN